MRGGYDPLTCYPQGIYRKTHICSNASAITCLIRTIFRMRPKRWKVEAWARSFRCVQQWKHHVVMNVSRTSEGEYDLWSNSQLKEIIFLCFFGFHFIKLILFDNSFSTSTSSPTSQDKWQLSLKTLPIVNVCICLEVTWISTCKLFVDRTGLLKQITKKI